MWLSGVHWLWLFAPSLHFSCLTIVNYSTTSNKKILIGIVSIYLHILFTTQFRPVLKIIVRKTIIWVASRFLIYPAATIILFHPFPISKPVAWRLVWDHLFPTRKALDEREKGWRSSWWRDWFTIGEDHYLSNITILTGIIIITTTTSLKSKKIKCSSFL